MFGDFFLVNKIKKIRDLLESAPLYLPMANNVATHLSDFLPVSLECVKKILSNSKPTTCPLDPIPSSIVKQHSDTLLPFITQVINSSLQSCSFDKSWKTAIVRPLIKKQGLTPEPSNFRPVSNLPFLSKLTEKCALQQLSHHFDTHDLLPSYQSAYRPCFSTETATLHLHHTILQQMEHQRVTAFVAADLSAAFDTVDHRVLLSVLNDALGVDGNALNWIADYLRDRSFSVIVNGSKSEEKCIDFSVPQGSILGPVLFNAYSSTL